MDSSSSAEPQPAAVSTEENIINKPNKIEQDENKFEISSELQRYIFTKVLDSQTKDKLIRLYLDGNKQERIVITKMFPQAFQNPEFVQSLIKAGTIRVAQTVEREFDPSYANSVLVQNNGIKNKNNNTNNIENNNSLRSCFIPMNDNENDETNNLPQRRERDEENKEGSDETEENNNTNNQQQPPSTLKRDLQQRCRTLRKQIDEAVCTVVGAGPHKVRFGIAKNQADCDKIIAVFGQQFVYPGIRELRSTYVKPPQKVSTRHRSIRTGNFCWFLQYVKTGEICCAASVNIHPIVEGYDDRIIFEVPLYATAAGFKNLGLARLLNAAIQELAIFMKAELVLISADQGAIPFWTNKNLGGGGYAPLKRGQRDSLNFLYENMCQLFGDVTLLGWVPPRGADALASGLMEAALARTPKFVVDGPARLPLI